MVLVSYSNLGRNSLDLNRTSSYRAMVRYSVWVILLLFDFHHRKMKGSPTCCWLLLQVAPYFLGGAKAHPAPTIHFF